jgi:nucleoid-associated protein YgaU
MAALEISKARLEEERRLAEDLERRIAGVDTELTQLRAETARLEREIEEAMALPTTWTVRKGECLWWIAGYEVIYNDPLKWPRIYEANTDQIKDPDLIYPDQVLRIPR